MSNHRAVIDIRRYADHPALSKMTREQQEQYRKQFPNPQFPPVRWVGDGLGETLGPLDHDDLDMILKTPPSGPARAIAQHTVIDLAALLEAFEARCRAKHGSPGLNGEGWPTLRLAECRILGCTVIGRREEFAIACGLSFFQCEFLTRCEFPLAHFNQAVNFDGCVLVGGCDFQLSHFQGTTDFCGCYFMDSAGFEYSTFRKDARFFKCRFYQDAHLDGATFAASASWALTEFRSQCFFGESVFSGPLVLSRSSFAQALDLTRAQMNLAETFFLDIGGLRVAGRAALQGDLRLSFEQISSRTSLFSRRRGRLAGESLTPFANQPWPLGPGATTRRDLARYAAEQYNVLAANFAASTEPGSWRLADWCHYRYKDLMRIAARSLRNPLRWFEWLFLKVCFGYGIKWWRLIMTALAIVVLFGGIYSTVAAQQLIDNRGNCLSAIEASWDRHVWVPLYFSASAFTTMGYGDWHPEGAIRIVAAVEALSGMVLIALMTIVVARRIIR
jgi:hypothetical protein